MIELELGFYFSDTLEGCLLQLCYEFFTRKVTEDANLQHMIHVQLVHLVSNISVVEGGPTILFGSTCACCMEVCVCVMYKLHVYIFVGIFSMQLLV